MSYSLCPISPFPLTWSRWKIRHRRENTSPHFSPGFDCGGGSGYVCCVPLGRRSIIFHSTPFRISAMPSSSCAPAGIAVPRCSSRTGKGAWQKLLSAFVRALFQGVGFCPGCLKDKKNWLLFLRGVHSFWPRIPASDKMRYVNFGVFCPSQAALYIRIEFQDPAFGAPTPYCKADWQPRSTI